MALQDPVLIQLLRGDATHLDQLVLEDGEVAISRNTVLDGGIQSGGTVPDHIIRCGDGITPGGFVPGSEKDTLLEFLSAVLASMVRDVDDLKGVDSVQWRIYRRSQREDMNNSRVDEWLGKIPTDLTLLDILPEQWFNTHVPNSPNPEDSDDLIDYNMGIKSNIVVLDVENGVYIKSNTVNYPIALYVDNAYTRIYSTEILPADAPIGTLYNDASGFVKIKLE